MKKDIHYFNKICYSARRFDEIAILIDESDNEGQSLKEKRARLITKLAGKTDDLSAERIANYLEENK